MTPTPRQSSRPRGGGRDGEAGSVTLIGLALVVFVLLAGMLAVDVGLLAATRARMQAAADLAALAALTPAAGTGTGRARAIATANGADDVQCACSPLEAVVGVSRHVTLLPSGITVNVHAVARAVLPPPSSSPTPGAPASARGGGTGPPVPVTPISRRAAPRCPLNEARRGTPAEAPRPCRGEAR